MKTSIFLLLTLGTVAISSTAAARISISPVVIDGNGVLGCPSNADLQEARNALQSLIERRLQNYSNNPNCGPGIWKRVFYLNTSSQDQSCPGDWNVHTTSSVRGCVGADASCQSAYSDKVNVEYSKVCGRAIGTGTATPDGFHRPGGVTIEDVYLDGVSITHGAPGSRTHIWSFGVVNPYPFACPCDSTNAALTPPPPPEVGEHYFCSRRISDSRNLWTGTDCTSDNPCCSFYNPPYSSVQLPSPTTDQIELRICSDQHVGDEYVLVQFAEIYVQYLFQ